MARYVFMRSDLTLESIERQMERELSPAFCRSLLARIGVHELPRAEFPADAVLRGFLSADVLTDLQSRVALHALAAPWVLPTDSVADMAAARHAWEVVSWSPFPVAEPGFWSLSGTQPTLEKDAIALQMDSLQIESLQKRGRDFSAQLVGDGLHGFGAPAPCTDGGRPGNLPRPFGAKLPRCPSRHPGTRRRATLRSLGAIIHRVRTGALRRGR
jgi:hypothetical protein